MTSLGEHAAGVRVRPATDDEAFLLGALHLQGLRRAGQAVDPGPPSHVQAFARSWQQRSGDLPAWVAELAGEHVGMAICRVPLLPRLGRPVPELLAAFPLVGSLEGRSGGEPGGAPGGDRGRAPGGDRGRDPGGDPGGALRGAPGVASGGDSGRGQADGQVPADAVSLALVRGVVAWAGAQGYQAVDVSPEIRLPAAVLDAARAVVKEHRRVSLPTNP